MEIGFGRGMFLIQRAAAAPGSFLLGFEIKTKWAYLVEQRCRREGLPNVRVSCGDVREIFPRLQPRGQVARAFMHFPDPWWKKRHAKRRLVGSDLLDELARLLRPGGELFLQSDVEERAELHLAHVAQHSDFVLAGQDGWLEDNPYLARSNRERRAIEDGIPIYRTLAHRV
ncbi:MAG: tRNA (guanosine(46)-N7)-methyltransferase TrmB [Myxococcales bacterium]|nr:tRNA (guanosine(46)-N7)-methyltransferase TrmB [Myxococcales bacterium]